MGYLNNPEKTAEVSSICILIYNAMDTLDSVADPESGAFLTPGSEIRDG
jgi:hypothetical protein